jgi:hypothetical protein
VKPLVELWDGTTWSVAKSPGLAGGSEAPLTAVSCVSPSDCLAVGDFDSVGAFALTGSGSTWRITNVPNFFGPSAQPVSTGVSCTVATCVVAGSYITTTSPVSHLAVLVRESKGKWVRSKAPDPSGRGDYLNGVTCPAPTSCLVVGAYGELDLRPLIEIDF